MKQKINRMSFGKKGTRIDVFHMNKPWKNGLAGMITSKLFQEKIAIVVDDDLLSGIDADFACLAVGKNGIAPRIIMANDIFYGFKRGCPMARTTVFHELGHYVHGDINSSFDSDQYDGDRIENAEKGLVLSVEAAADEFAVSYLGAKTALDGLSTLKDRVDSISEESLAALELQARINLIQDKLKS